MNGSFLPNELLVIIGEQLGEHEDRWNLIFVCRHFYQVLLPLLYRSPKLRRWQHFKSFFHAIRKNERLALGVHELDLGDWISKQVFSREEREALKASVAVRKHFWRLISTDNDNLELFTTALCEGNTDAWVMLILPLMSQLKQLSLPWSNNAGHMIQSAFSTNDRFKENCRFQHLRKVSFHFCSEGEEGDVEFGSPEAFSERIMPFFLMPSLRELSVNKVIDPSSRVSKDYKGPIGFSAITDIDLHESCANEGMHKLISSCATLKSFKYQHSDLPLASIGYHPDRLHSSLVQHKESLEILWLDHHGTHYPYTAAGLNQTYKQWIGSFADFTALRELRIPLHNLLDIRYGSVPATPLFECLPSSLESIYIEVCDQNLFSMLVLELGAVIADRENRFPSLQHVGIEGRLLDPSSVKSGDIDLATPDTPEWALNRHIMLAAETLQQGCDAAGVGLQIYHSNAPSPLQLLHSDTEI